MNVVVLGASNNPERYSNKAVKMLLQKGHRPIPVHPSLDTVENQPVRAVIEDVPDPIDTISVYLSPEKSDQCAQGILASGARRVIFNPGAENPALAKRLEEHGMEVVEACTLVLLSTNQF